MTAMKIKARWLRLQPRGWKLGALRRNQLVRVIALLPVHGCGMFTAPGGAVPAAGRCRFRNGSRSSDDWSGDVLTLIRNVRYLQR